jgi:hypothetical protein
MDEELTAATFVPWLARESQKWARLTANKGDPKPYLWSVAVDALQWLRDAEPDERNAALRAVKEYLDTGKTGEIAVPQDQHEANCFLTVLRFVYAPPQPTL